MTVAYMLALGVMHLRLRISDFGQPGRRRSEPHINDPPVNDSKECLWGYEKLSEGLDQREAQGIS